MYYMRDQGVKRPERVMIPCRIGIPGVDWMDQIALDETGRAPGRRKVTRSHVIRASLAVARRHEKELRQMLREL